MRFAFTALLLVVALAAAHPARAAWSDYKDEQEIFAIVHGGDGKPREIKIWLLVLDGHGFIRTRNTSWKPDLERDPKAALRIKGKEIPIRPIPVKDPELYNKVNEAYTAKYGVTPHVFLSVMRPFLGPWNVYRVEER
ncbi:MAG: DUF2255 family protein [Deltaproteobacteria bacterium]|nr:MAG: DUF2255 family protein [Deltaproteobacteria bacterium]